MLDMMERFDLSDVEIDLDIGDLFDVEDDLDALEVGS